MRSIHVEGQSNWWSFRWITRPWRCPSGISVESIAFHSNSWWGEWKLLYAGNLVVTAEPKEGAVSMFGKREEAMFSRSLKIDVEKTKQMVSGKPLVTRQETERHPCGVWASGFGANSTFCIRCNKWVHGRCLSEHRMMSVVGFRCSTCLQPPRTVSDESIMVKNGTIEEVESFCYLGDVLDRGCTADAAVRARILAAWGKWREISRLICHSAWCLYTTSYALWIRSLASHHEARRSAFEE